MIWEILQTVFTGVMALAMCIGVFKLYFVLEEHPPHTHTERHQAQPLTTDGILYPRGTERRAGS